MISTSNNSKQGVTVKLHKSIKTKIFVTFSLIFILSFGTITSLWYIEASDNSLQLARNSAFEIIKSENENFEVTLRDIDYLSTVISLNRPNVIDVLSSSRDNTEYQGLLLDRKLDDFIESLYGYKFYISSILVCGENGKRYSRGSTLSTETIKNNYWYDQIISGKGKRFFIRTHSNSANGNASSSIYSNVISIARAIMDKNKVLGFVMIDFRYDIVDKIFSAKIPYKSTLFVIDEDGNFVYHPDPEMLNRNISNTVYGTIGFDPDKSEGNLMKKINKQDYYIEYYKSDYTGWTTVGLISKSELMRNSVKTRNNTIAISIISLIAVLAVSLIVSYSITINIFKLRDAMQSVAKGNFNVDVNINSGDEIEELSNGFKYMTGKIRDLLNNIKSKEKQKRIAEMKAFQAQVNPHFLYNTLNTVRWLASAQKADNISSLVTSLIQLLSSSISKDQLISIKDEIEYVKEYINIQQYKYCDKFEVHFSIDDEILNCRIPKFTLQPIIENSLIHGIEPKEGRGLIIVKGFMDGNDVNISVTDNGVGILEENIETILNRDGPNQNRERFNSIGIANVQERIKLYFGEKYGLNIESSPGVFTTVTITIPAVYNEGECEYV